MFIVSAIFHQVIRPVSVCVAVPCSFGHSDFMPLSQSEQVQLQALLKKASEGADAEANSSESGFSLVSGVTIGAMTDGAKRRACSPVTGDSSGAEKISYDGAMVDMYANPRGLMPGYTPELEAPYVPKTSECLSAAITLPPNVPSAEQWGRTLITWGQFKGCGLSYHDLLTRTDEKANGYKKWCRSPLHSAEGRLLDFCRYLHFCDQLTHAPTVRQGPIIPGTTEVRQYK